MRIERGGTLCLNDNDIVDGVLTVPDYIVKIKGITYDKKEDILKIVMPNSVRVIGQSAFEGCKNLEEIVFSKHLKRIENRAFANCVSIKSIYLPDTLKGMGEEAFSCCLSLEKIRIGKNVKTIGYCAFYGCESLKLNKKIKATDENICCNDYTFLIGRWSSYIDLAIAGKCGYHYVENPFDIFNFYWGEIGKNVRFFEIEIDKVNTIEYQDDCIHVCNRVKLTREILSYSELLSPDKHNCVI